MSKLAPGKGAHWHLNAGSLAFIANSIRELADVLVGGVDRDDFDTAIEELNDKLDNGEASELFAEARHMLGWQYAKDKFGEKLFNEMDWKSGTYRVTLVLKGTELKHDIREWYDPDAS